VVYDDKIMAERQHVVKRDAIALLIADVYEAAGALRRQGEALADAEGQTQARWQLLSVVSERALTVPQAARRLGVTRQAIQRVADDIVRQGLANYEANPEHRASPLVELTPSGRAVLQRINRRAQRSHRDLALTDPDIETTRRVLHALLERVRKPEGDERS
jgi:DNA-binding MarR family transcriptional regulator